MPLKKGSLLIVDDDSDFRTALAEMLQNHGITVKTASNGNEALALLSAPAVDAVLSDINMPDMNGLELLFHVRESGLDLPFVFLTGYADKERTIEALRLGAIDFLEKPFDAKQLVEVISKALELGIAMKEIAAETEKLYISAEIHLEERQRLQKMKLSILKMRVTKQIYGKAS